MTMMIKTNERKKEKEKEEEIMNEKYSVINTTCGRIEFWTIRSE
jgi:hypothetical protein